MPINLSVPESSELKPRITVFGVGGAGGNAVNNMIEASLEGVEFVVANTDAQAIRNSQCDRRIQMGSAITEGLGAGSQPEVGRAAAEESMDEILEHLAGAHMAFITAGMGGGTGTGAAPVIARAARERDILTVGVVTKPFHFEGARRMRIADAGIEELQRYVDTLLIIPNQNLFRIANEKTTFAQAFGMADEVLHSGVRGITDLMVMPGLINLDFADVRTVMNEMGKAMMGTGEAEGEKRAIEAAEAAISNPLLDEVSMKGARGVLINITGGMDMTLFEVDEAANRIRSEVDPDANIIVGSTFDDALDGKMRVSVVATGIESEAGAQPAEAEQADLISTSPRNRPAPWRQGAAPGAAAAPVMRKDLAPNPVREAQRVLRNELTPETAAKTTDSEVAAKAPATPPSAPLEPAPRADALSAEYVEEPAASPEAKPEAAPQPQPQPVRAETRQPQIEGDRGNLSFNPFRRGKNGKIGVSPRDLLMSLREERPAPPEAKPAPPAAAEPQPRVRHDGNGELFGTDKEDEQLEIPAFLRRTANR